MGGLLGLKAIAPIAVALALVSGLRVMAPSGAAPAGSEDPAASPLFERRLQEMGTQFELAPAAVAHRPSGAEGSQAAQAQPQAFLAVSEAISACISSGCIASACVLSVCAGSGCSASVCAGSACDDCNRLDAPNPSIAMAGGRAYCPLDGDNALGEMGLAGFEVARGPDGTEIRFAAGSDVERYRVYRSGQSVAGVLVAEGLASGSHLIRVHDAQALKSYAGYTLELVDGFGRVSLAQLDDAPAAAPTP